MKREEFAKSGSSEDAAPGGGSVGRARPPIWSRTLEGTAAILRYGSANLLLLFASLALIAGGYWPWLVVVPALVFASFADDAVGDDDVTLDGDSCLFCTLNLYATVPLVALLALLLARFAGGH